MSKAQRNRQESVRQRIAAQQAAAKRAETRRRMILGGGVIVVVLAVVIVLVVLKVGGGGPSPAKNSTEPVGGVALPASVARNVTSVPVSVLNSVGVGSVIAKPATSITGPPLTSNGKPEMLYIGAEFCPYCAAMRWSMAVALSRFGTLSTPLKGIHSSSTDTNPNTATLTFYKSSYSSPYLTFTPVENEDRNRKQLQPLTAAQNATWAKYQPDPSTRGYPFIDIGNRYMLSVIYDPQVLQGLTWSQIAGSLNKPDSAVAKGVNGAANVITAAICKTTGGKPGNVCTSPGVQAAASHL